MNQSDECKKKEGMNAGPAPALRLPAFAEPDDRVKPTPPDGSDGQKSLSFDEARFCVGLISIYKSILNETLPERMHELLKKIEWGDSR